MTGWQTWWCENKFLNLPESPKDHFQAEEVRHLEVYVYEKKTPYGKTIKVFTEETIQYIP